MKRKLVRLSLLCLVLLTSQLALSHPAFGTGVQPMAVLKGAEVIFGVGANQFLPAFCLDVAKTEPGLGTDFSDYRGNVKLTLRNGTSKVYDLADVQQRTEAFSNFQIFGTGSYDSLKFSRLNPKLTKIEFITPGLAHRGPPSDFLDAIKRLGTFQELTTNLTAPKSAPTLRSIPLNESYKEAQSRIWRSPTDIARVREPGNKSVTFDLRRRDPARTLSQEIINLDGRGDAILLRYGDVNVLVDTGLAADGFQRILPKLPKNIRLDMILTHRDQDHIGNTTRIIAAANDSGVKIDNIVMSTYQVPSFADKEAAKTQVVRRLLDQLEKSKFTRADLASPVAVFSSPTSTPIFTGEQSLTTLVKEAKRELEAGGIIGALLTKEEKELLVEAESSSIHSYDLALAPELKVRLLQKAAPNSPNESSLITRIVHNGRATLYTGDINEQVMDDLLKFRDSLEPSLKIARVQLALSQLKAKYPSAYSDLTAQGTQSLSPVELFRSFVQKIQPLLEDAAFRTDLQSLASVDGALNAHVMKWPHHAWLPRSAKGRQTLKDFIQAVNPEVIVFSTSPETSEIRFQASEFSNAEAFVARLKSGADPLSTWLITRFSEGTRASVSSYDGGGVNRDLKQALATELTGLMRGPLIYRSDLFAGYDLEDLQPQLAAGVSEAMRPALNRELLERAYPELGQISGQNVERVKKFLREMFPYRHFTFVITGSDGDVKVLSLNDLQQHERQDSNSSVSLAR